MSHIFIQTIWIFTQLLLFIKIVLRLFIGPKEVVKTWQRWGVPAEKTRVIEPGQEIKVNDVNVVALEAFDRTALITSDDPENTFKGKMPQDMNELAVNYLFETSGGTVYHAGDSHYSNLFAKHGNQYAIDVCLGAYGENPRGITDKITSVDMLRMAESLNAKVVIPVHYDIWSNFMADPKEIMEIWKFKKIVYIINLNHIFGKWVANLFIQMTKTT